VDGLIWRRLAEATLARWMLRLRVLLILCIYGNSRAEAMYPLYIVDAAGRSLDASTHSYSRGLSGVVKDKELSVLRPY